MIERAYSLTTDLYEMTMAAAYFDNGIKDRAIFELFVRRLPENRSYLIAAGLEQALDYLSSLRFAADQIDYLRRHPSFKNVSSGFFDYLEGFRFTGDVWAMPEGTIAFPNEPMLRVAAPIIEAQIVETFLLATINFQTLIASKAARVVSAAAGRSVVEFGTRRAHGSEAGLFAARAAYIAGCTGTSNVEAGHLFNIPTFGTLAHSFIMAFETEDEAFRAFLKVFPRTATVLVDTYDTLSAVERLAKEFGPRVQAVRLDSGDLLDLSIRVRRLLDEVGMNKTTIFASSDLNEYRIKELIERGARIDSFGVGTELATSADAPALPGVYKLVGLEANGEVSMRIKLSKDKGTYPGPKQVWRKTGGDGKFASDLVTLADEQSPSERDEDEWQPLISQVMKGGKHIKGQAGGLEAARARATESLARLPDRLLAIEESASFQVEFSGRLREERERVEREILSSMGRR
jgi:nicotinate phosphoribosyltransferase